MCIYIIHFLLLTHIAFSNENFVLVFNNMLIILFICDSCCDQYFIIIIHTIFKSMYTIYVICCSYRLTYRIGSTYRT